MWQWWWIDHFNNSLPQRLVPALRKRKASVHLKWIWYKCSKGRGQVRCRPQERRGERRRGRLGRWAAGCRRSPPRLAGHSWDGNVSDHCIGWPGIICISLRWFGAQDVPLCCSNAVVVTLGHYNMGWVNQQKWLGPIVAHGNIGTAEALLVKPIEESVELQKRSKRCEILPLQKFLNRSWNLSWLLIVSKLTSLIKCWIVTSHSLQCLLAGSHWKVERVVAAQQLPV